MVTKAIMDMAIPVFLYDLSMHTTSTIRASLAKDSCIGYIQSVSSLAVELPITIPSFTSHPLIQSLSSFLEDLVIPGHRTPAETDLGYFINSLTLRKPSADCRFHQVGKVLLICVSQFPASDSVIYLISGGAL